MVIALDTETHLIQRGLAAPPMVCVSLAFRSYSEDGNGGLYIPRHLRMLPPEEALFRENGDVVTALLSREGWRKVGRIVLSWAMGGDEATGGGRLIGHNLPYDALVLMADDPGLIPHFRDLYRHHHASDTWIRERLRNIADGLGAKFPNFLANLVTKYLGEEAGAEAKAAKHGPDAWRLRYAELDGIPLTEWPEAAIAYPLADASDTLAVWEKQGGISPAYPSQATEARETGGHLALHSMGVWGVRTDGERVAGMRAAWRTRIEAGERAAIEGGWYRPERWGPKGGHSPAGISATKLREVISEAFDGEPPRTARGAIKTDEDTLLAAAELPGAPRALVAYADSRKAAKLESVWGSALASGAQHPVTAEWNPLVDTGRTSCRNPPWQQQPRGAGTRECVVPRDGFVIVAADFNAAELRALAQLCKWLGLGQSMIRAFEAGIDLHCHTAATYNGLSYAEFFAKYQAGDKWAAEQRQAAKAVNFGIPGGLGARKLAAHVYGQTGIAMSESEAKAYKAAWSRAWPEAAKYLYLIGNKVEAGGGTMTVTHPVSGRKRGGVGYTDGCNGFFQGLVADIVKDATWRLWVECYTDRSSPLYGSRPTLCMHDELIGEVPREWAAEAAKRWAEVMIEAARAHAPDVPWTCKPIIMPERWVKE